MSDEIYSNTPNNTTDSVSHRDNQTTNSLVLPNQTTSSALSSIHDAQTLIDDHKEQIGDDLYLQLSNINNKIYKENTNNFYRITYIDYKVSQPAMGIYLSRPHIKTEILTLTDEMYNIYTNIKNKNIREKGYYLPTSHNLLGLDLKRLNTNPLVNIYGSCCNKNIECSDCGEETICECPETHCISLDFDPTIINIQKL